MRPLLLPLAIGAALAPAAVATAATLDVGTGQTYATITAAEAASGSGDTIVIHDGTYHEAVVFHKDDLTVTGVVGGSGAIVDMTGMSIDNEKGVFVSDGSDFTLTDVTLMGASVGDGNGAGLRWEGGGTLTVKHCRFASNEDGILGGDSPANTADVEDSEFVDNSRGDAGYTHSVYFSEITSVTFIGNWSHALYAGGTDVGHLFKSRAALNIVAYNRLTAEDNPSSYEVNIPEGGEAYVIGNAIQQKVGGQRIMISFGDGDGTQRTGSHLYLVNNTMVSESDGDATFVRTTQSDAQLYLANNLFVGPGTVSTGGVPTTQTNLAVATESFVDQASWDYHLQQGADAIDTGTGQGSAGAPMSLVADHEYVYDLATEPRLDDGHIDVGAFEYGTPLEHGETVDPIDGGPGSGSNGDTGSSGGGCCQTGGTPDFGVLLGMLAALRARRPRRVSSK